MRDSTASGQKATAMVESYDNKRRNIFFLGLKFHGNNGPSASLAGVVRCFP